MYVCHTPYLNKHTPYDYFFLVHKCEMMTSLDAFLSFSKFWFSGLSAGEGGWRAKNGPNLQKIISQSISQEPCLIWLCFLVHMCKMMISPAIFFSFFKILIFWVFQTLSINTKRKFWGMSHLLHMCLIFEFKS